MSESPCVVKPPSALEALAPEVGILPGHLYVVVVLLYKGAAVGTPLRQTLFSSQNLFEERIYLLSVG